jgi:3-hydroxyisobutyrate dehydrogenase-like beta-hydroxyacid dehydrogenase
MRIGFIGLGTMGQHMAHSLIEADYELLVHDLRREAGTPHEAAGAVWADTPAQVAEEADVVFTSLPGPAEVESVALGEAGLLQGMRAGSVWFDLSTNSPTLVRRLNAVFAGKGIQVLDAPVSGGPVGARTRRLALWVGGEEATFERYRPLLEAIGDQPAYIGPIGAGSVAKLVHNAAGYGIQTALAEAFTLGVKAGVEPLALFSAIRQGASGRRRTFDGLIDQFLPAVFDPPSFALRLAHKDVTLATALGRELDVPLRLLNLALADLTEALNRGWGDRDSRIAMLLQEERAGVDIQVPQDDAAALREEA